MLALGALLCILAFLSFLIFDKIIWTATVMGVFILSRYFYRINANYLTVTNGELTKDLGTSIPLDEIIETKRIGNDYSFRSQKKSITIDKSKVHPESLPMLENLIQDLRAGDAAIYIL